MSRWITKCLTCGHWNIPTIEEDLEGMLGPYAVDRPIGPTSPGVVCAQCSRPIDPTRGHHEHMVQALKLTFPGFHIPQLIMPHHYTNPRRWMLLQAKRMGFGGVTKTVFYNESCGLPYDYASKLVTLADLKRAANLHDNKLELAKFARKNRGYKMVVMGIDWGGGGQDFNSLTAIAVVGILPTGVCEVIYGWRAPNLHDYINETAMVVHIAKELRVSRICDDLGAGTARSEFLLHSGMRPENLCSVLYLGPCRGPMCREVPTNMKTGLRKHWQLEKTRSLVSLCELIRSGYIRFFKYDFLHKSMPGMLHDFLALIENQVEAARGSNVLTIIRDKKQGPDDFAHAVNYAVHMLYYLVGQRYPDGVRETIMKEINAAIAKRLNPDRQDFDLASLAEMEGE
jgi:hypothetical protein